MLASPSCEQFLHLFAGYWVFMQHRTYFPFFHHVFANSVKCLVGLTRACCKAAVLIAGQWQRESLARKKL